MQNKIRLIKEKILKNHPLIRKKYGNNCEFLDSVVDTINLLIEHNATDEKISKYLENMENVFKLIDENINNLEKRNL